MSNDFKEQLLMNAKDIFNKLKSGVINPEDAEKELTQMIKNLSTESGQLPPQEVSTKQHIVIQSSKRFRKQGDDRNENKPVIDLQEIEPGIVQVTMQDKINKNTFSRELILGLIKSFETIQANSSYKVVILTGYGNYFASGGTKEALLAIYEGKAKFTDAKIYQLALDCKIPVIAAMQGHGIGAGWSLGMFCDFIIMSRESIYTCIYMKYGFTPGAGATLIFPEKLGISLAQEILFTGKSYRGAELEKRGIPFTVLPQKEVLPYAIQLAKLLSHSPIESLIALKDTIAEPTREKLSRTYEKELKMHDKTFVNKPEIKDRIQSLFSQISNDDKKSFSISTQKEKPAKNEISYNQYSQVPQDSIAIIGMSGQFPKSKNLAEYWENIAHARDCISEIPPERWSIDEFFDPDPKVPGKTYSKWMGILEDIDKFDPLFFNISPAEAELMDPQQRLFLETCWNCFEDAGISPSFLTGNRCGVFVGCATSHYGQLLSGEGLNALSFMGMAPSILSARISYLLNLKGPCLAVDTACSSSLVAIAEACNNLVLHNSDLALAGGVCVMIGPMMHIMTSKTGMLSRDGLCYTFDNRANGFVPGEGVGVVLLKRLPDAIHDQDHIYGVIRGWGINQDGKTNGMTAPSVISQFLLEKEIYERFRIDPETISMIEAHGTGTKLGDPIEVEALTKSFRFFTKKENYCALGSVKSNIGHLLTAAGAAGIIKVLLALQHRMLPPTINFETLNEHISIEKSPFYINTKLQPWEVNQGNRRCAAVSSFGFSGTNAHLIIEEYIPEAADNKTSIHFNSDTPALFVLSAKTEERLHFYIEKMKEFIDAHEDLYPADIAYTLQTGRNAMDYRLAFITDSRKALLKTLTEFIENKSSPEMMIGRVKKNEDGVLNFQEDEDMEALLQTWIQKKKLKKIAELWVKGLNIDWNKLYGNNRPRRISLPTYPFERRRYWIPEIENKSGKDYTLFITGAGLIHPLLHQNISDLSEECFSSTFTGKEFFFADHIMKGKHVFPGVAYLEMARAAVEAAAGIAKDGKNRIKLKNIVWATPLLAGEEAVKVNIGLVPAGHGEIIFEVYSSINEDDIIHSHGKAEIIESDQEIILDITSLLARKWDRVLTSEDCYDAFQRKGIMYGPGHQGIETLYVGEGEILARLSMPALFMENPGEYILHPSIMDSAVQAATGFMIGTKQAISPLPGTLDLIEIIGSCTQSMWATVKYGEKGNKKKFDINLCDDSGKVMVRLKGLEMHETMEAFISNARGISNQNSIIPEKEEPFEIMTFEEVWQEQKLSGTMEHGYKTIVCFILKEENLQELAKAIQIPGPGVRLIFIEQDGVVKSHAGQMYTVKADDPLSYKKAFINIREQTGEVDAVVYFWALEDKKYIREYSPIVYMLQGAASAGLKPGQYILTGEYRGDHPKGKAGEGLDRCYLESWMGFERSIGLVMPQTRIRGIYEEVQKEGIGIKGWMERVWKELGDSNGRSALYREGRRYVCKVRPVKMESVERKPKSGGTYLITGGCGGLGILFAEHLARTRKANLVLTGRSEIDEGKREKVKAIENAGSRVLYCKADVCNTTDMKEVYKKAKNLFGGIDGIIHAAGIHGGISILERDIKDFQKVLDPKVKGTVVLDKMLNGEKIEFICYFSSSAGILGDLGSCDYAIGNRFLMSYAYYRNQQRDMKGKTFVINWPFWREGGMGFGDDSANKMYLISSGQRLLETGEGTTLFEKLLNQEKIQHLVIAGQKSRVHRFLGLKDDYQSRVNLKKPCNTGKGRQPGMKGLSIEECLEWDLKDHINRLLKISKDKINREDNLADFGFDSISLGEFANGLTRHYGIEITPAVFFGHSTVGKLIEYFLQEYGKKISEFYSESPVIENKEEKIYEVKTIKRQRYRKSRFRNTDEPIAIIGMSGRFPESRNIDEMWEILVQGKEVIKEYPEERYKGGPYEKSNWKCGCIPGVSEFDPLFFEISPREAEGMDPRQRLLLQESWNALEDAGYGPGHIRTSRIGMFVGVEQGEYQHLAGEELSLTSNHEGILASRLAYFLGFNGPVIAINTACSSGLVAAHEACLSLQNGECDTTVAAGVNLILSPVLFEVMNRVGMSSEDGKCYAFDKRANGMVAGEAVAVVVLKKLSMAIADCDHIYAVIKGSGINYDGKTNGITAPSGIAQVALLKSVYEKYGVNPEDIEYIVTHGTGTKLGDPVEVNALNEVFKEYTKKKGYCALTSTKTNFGHTLAASGLVSLISLVQAFCYNTIPASLNYEEENEYINWAGSPFYVNKANNAWKDKEGKRRTGAVSAFGMSGTNAHMVVESYPENTGDVGGQKWPCFFLALSAKSPEVLREKVKDLTAVLEEKDWDRDKLTRMSYTLMESRYHFNYRCAIVIRDREDAIAVLNKAGEKEKLPNMFRGKVPGDFTGQKAIEQYAEELVDQARSLKNEDNKYREKLYAIAELYCQGYEIPWSRMYGEKKPRRINLPTYPFAKDQYWIKVTGKEKADKGIPVNHLHPLLHENTSNLMEQQFSSMFTGKEFFLADHRVNGQKILPGVAHLEMARAAVEAAAEVEKGGDEKIRLKNVVWLRPIVVDDESVKVNISLIPDDNGEIMYEVYSVNNKKDSIVYSQGTAELITIKEESIIDLKTLQDKKWERELSAGDCYGLFKEMGIDYGPGYKGIKIVYAGDGVVLARLAMPSSVMKTAGEYMLHPSMMDPAFQAVIGLMNTTGESRAAMPFAVDNVEIMDSCVPMMWVLLHYSEAGNRRKINIDLCDDKGKICVRMKGLSLRVKEGAFDAGNSAQEISAGTSMDLSIGNTILIPLWDREVMKKAEQSPQPKDRILVIGGTKNSLKVLQECYPLVYKLVIKNGDDIVIISGKIKKIGKIDHVVWIAPQNKAVNIKNDGIIEDQEQGVVQLFRLIKALLNLGYGAGDLCWSVITTQTQSVHAGEEINPTHAGVHGLTGVMAKEYSNWKVRSIDLERNIQWPVENIFRLPWDSQGNLLIYRNGEWYKQKLVPVRYPAFNRTLYREGGVYIVIGGAGGIGEAWSEYLIQSYNARIVWIGRRKKNKAIQSQIERLACIGHAPLYISADASDLNDLAKAYKIIKKRFSQVNGLVQSAFAVMDKSLQNTDDVLFREGLKSKIDVSIRMVQVFREEPLDFILLFSSISSIIKDPGKCSYVVGNVFEDSFASYLSTKLACAVKVINWGYWGEVGSGRQVPQHIKERIYQSGFSNIDPSVAMETLEMLLSGPVNQIMLLKTAKPLVMEGIVRGELIEINSEGSYIDVKELRDLIPGQRSQLKLIREKEFSQQVKMEELLCRLLWCELKSMGCFIEKMEIPGLKTRIGLSEKYDRWFKESIEILVQKDLLRDNGSVYIVEDLNIDKTKVWKEYEREKARWMEDPCMKAPVKLVEAMLRALPEILKGEIPATNIMFPDSSMELVEGIYKNNAIADYFNEVISDAVSGYIQGRVKIDPDARIRIIEIGAGTGGTSSVVFKKLGGFKKYIEEYCYTDLSKAFLIHGEKSYKGENQYLTFKIFDTGEPAAVQGFKAGSYDLVIAANVLHATKNIRESLRNAKALLRKNGIILLNEIACKSVYAHMTFGLMDGWWLYEDAELRIPGSPGLYPEMWKKVLEKEGFLSVIYPAEDAHDLGQQIVIAVSNGVARQRLKQKGKTGQAKKEEVNRETVLMRKKVIKGADVTDQMINDYVRVIILEIIAEELKIGEEKIQDERSLSEYGVDSIIAVNLINSVNKKLSISLKTTDLFDYNNVRLLTDYIIQEHKSSLITLLSENVREYEDKEVMGANVFPSNEEKDHGNIRRRVYNRFRKDEKNREIDNNIQGKEPIAIIGMSSRFAKSPTAEDLWKHLSDGDCLVDKITRWDLSRVYPAGYDYCNVGSFLDDIEQFDPLFFNISGLEATYMDPQQRIILEESWKALEDAGYVGSGISGRLCGVYIGCATGDYIKLCSKDPPPQVFWGNGSSLIPARIAYFLNLQGPAVAVDTACSSSLVAVHFACQGLWNRETELALAGGIFIQCTPQFYMMAEKSKMLSPTGLCHTFDDSADGYIPGEGAGVIVLKRLNDALADGDHIYGVIRGTGINQDGTSNGILAPSVKSQESLIRNIYDTFHIDPARIQMVEAHGTATILGDPIEFNAITRAFRHFTDKKTYCAIGSIKTNLGHTALAAGLAGMIKVLLSLKHRKIPPSLHFKKGNSKINFEESPFYVNTELKDWDVEPGMKRCAAVSSFGLNGTNAHIVIEEAPLVNEKTGEKPGYLIVLSARNNEQLQKQAEQIIHFIKADIDCGNLSFTLLSGRKHFKHRLACVVRSRQEFIKLLKKWLEKKNVPQIIVSELKETDHEQASLKRYGNECILKTHKIEKASEYLENLSVIADLYTKGYMLEFEQLFSNEKYRRISLPTYPFAKDRYWTEEDAINERESSLFMGYINSSAQENQPDSQFSAVENKSIQYEDLMYLPLWEEQRQQEVKKVCNYKSVLIVYTETSRIFADIIQKYYHRASGTEKTITIKVTNRTERISEYEWLCDRNDPLGFENCLREYGSIEAMFFISEFSKSGSGKDGFNKNDEENRFPNLDKRQQINVIQLLRLIRYLKQSEMSNNRMDCFIITQDNYRMKDNCINPLGGAITGLTYSIAQGDYRIALRNIDISAEDLAKEDNKIKLLSLLLNIKPTDRGELIKISGGNCYKQVFYKLNSVNHYKGEGLRKGGVYVILGGSGTVGGVFTRYLFKKYQAKVVWIGRRDGSSDEIKKKMEIVKEYGDTPLYIRADVKELDQMKNAVKKIKEQYETINGVIFCGLVFNVDNSISKTTENDFLDVLTIKTTGSINIYKAFEDEQLDFMCFCSSAQGFSFSGAANFSAYAAGITFSDIYVQFLKNKSKFPVGTINWGFWKKRKDFSEDSIYVKNIQFLDHEEGFNCFEYFIRLFRGKILNQIICFRINDMIKDIMKLKKETVSIYKKITKVPAESQQAITESNELAMQKDIREKQKLNELNLEGQVKHILHSQLAKSIKIPIERISFNVAFSEYGMDSVMGVSFVKKINDVLGLELNSAILFDYTTINQLTGFIMKSYENEVKIRMGEESAHSENTDKQSDKYFKTVTSDNRNFIEMLEKKFFIDNESSDSILHSVMENEVKGNEHE